MLELAVEPVFLARAHERSTGVVGDGMDVVSVPVEVCDGAVIVPGVEHQEVDEFSDAEVSPDA